jgi:protein subunit release factor A
MKLNKDFKIEITRGSGPGGQHKNKVETCVKITHIPTGITETCQDSRSKLKNLELAKKRILDKLNRIEELKKQEENNNIRLDKIKNPIRIRTYDFKSKRVYDHRTKKQADLYKVLNGELDLLR